MAQTWNAGANPLGTVADDADDLFSELIGGVQTALTCYSGSSDPSTGAPTAWGVGEVGTWWKDTTDVDNIVWKQWQRLTAGPTYGWRTVRAHKHLWPTANVAVIAATSTGADVVYTDQSLASIADASLQDSGQLLGLVKVATLIIRCRFTTSTHPGGDKLFVKVRNKGGTNERKVYCAPTVNVWVEQEVECLLNSSEVFQYGVDTNAGGNTVEYQIDVKHAQEAL